MVTGKTGMDSQILSAYLMASLAEITAVAIYDKTVNAAASEAVDFLVVLSNAL